MGYIDKLIDDRIQDERSKKSLKDKYANLMFISGEVMGKWILGIVGAVLDGAVLYSLAFLSTRNHAGSLTIAIVGAIILQVVFGMATGAAAFAYFRKDYEQKGGGLLMAKVAIIALVCIGATLYLSWNTDKIVVTAAEKGYQQVDVLRGQDAFDTQLADLDEQYNTQRAALSDEMKRLQSDKVTYKGELVTRWVSSKAAQEIASQRIPALDRWYQSERATINSRRDQVMGVNLEDNKQVKESKAAYVAMGSAFAKGWNIGINILRALLITSFAYFLVVAGEGKEDAIIQTITQEDTTQNTHGKQHAVIQAFQNHNGSLRNTAKPVNTGNTVERTKSDGTKETLTKTQVKTRLNTYKRRTPTENNIQRVAEYTKLLKQLES